MRNFMLDLAGFLFLRQLSQTIAQFHSEIVLAAG